MFDTLSRQVSGWARAPWRPAVPLLAAQFVSGLWYMPQLSFFPVYLDESLALSTVTIAAIVALGQVAGMLAGLFGGGLGDAVGSKRVLVLGLVCAGVASLAFQVSLPALIAILWFIGGAGVGFHTLGGSSYLTRVADPRYLGVLAAFYALCLTMGGAVGNPAAGAILDNRGFEAFGLAVLVLVCVTLAGVQFLLPGLSAAGSGERAPVERFWRSAFALLGRPVVPMLIGLRFLPTVFYGMMGVLLPLMINRLAGSKAAVATYASVTLVVASAAQLAAGRAADRYGRRLPLFLAYGVLIVSALGLAAFSGDLRGVFVFGVLGNAAAWALSALMFPLVSDGVAKVEHGRVFGLLHASWSIGMIVGSLMGGSLVKVATGLPFLVAGLLQFVTIGLAWVYFRRVGLPGVRTADVPG